MAKKINGYARDNYGVIEFVELGKPEEGAWDEATLVVGKERVFTETEVRAMLREMIDYADETVPNHKPHAVPVVEDYVLKSIAAKHGITFP